jgi:hypothetical protein
VRGVGRGLPGLEFNGGGAALTALSKAGRRNALQSLRVAAVQIAETQGLAGFYTGFVPNIMQVVCGFGSSGSMRCA